MTANEPDNNKNIEELSSSRSNIKTEIEPMHMKPPQHRTNYMLVRCCSKIKSLGYDGKGFGVNTAFTW